jgi:hypothetical protein
VLRRRERVSLPLACHPQLDACGQQGRSGPYNLGSAYVVSRLAEASGLPVSAWKSAFELGQGLKGDREPATFEPPAGTGRQASEWFAVGRR